MGRLSFHIQEFDSVLSDHVMSLHSKQNRSVLISGLIIKKIITFFTEAFNQLLLVELQM